MNHSNCDHPATKAGRAACRKARAAQAIALRVEAHNLIDSYYNNTADFDEIIYALIAIFPELHDAYFATDAEPDELIGQAHLLISTI